MALSSEETLSWTWGNSSQIEVEYFVNVVCDATYEKNSYESVPVRIPAQSIWLSNSSASV